MEIRCDSLRRNTRPETLAVAAIVSLALGCGSPDASREVRPEPPREPAAAPPAPALDEVHPALAPGLTGPWTEELVLESAAFDVAGAPSVVVHAPPTFDARRPLRLVVFLHGWTGCARQLALTGEVSCRDGDRPRTGWGLAERFDSSGVNALFVVPQLAFLQRDGRAGRFGTQGGFRSFVDELLRAVEGRLGRAVDAAGLSSVTLMAHSAGFETALSVLSRGEVDVTHLVLFDALYRGVDPFAGWLEGDPERRVVSLYTGAGRTATQNRRFATRLMSGPLGRDQVASDAQGSLAALVSAHRAVIARSPAPHGEVPRQHMPELLGALDGARAEATAPSNPPAPNPPADNSPTPNSSTP